MPESALYCNPCLALTTGYAWFFRYCAILQHCREMKGILEKTYSLGSSAKELHYIL